MKEVECIERLVDAGEIKMREKFVRMEGVRMKMDTHSVDTRLCQIINTKISMCIPSTAAITTRSIAVSVAVVILDTSQ